MILVKSIYEIASGCTFEIPEFKAFLIESLPAFHFKYIFHKSFDSIVTYFLHLEFRAKRKSSLPSITLFKNNAAMHSHASHPFS